LPESKFPNEYSGVIFIQIDQRLKKLLQKYKEVPILWNTVYVAINFSKTDTSDVHQQQIRTKMTELSWRNVWSPATFSTKIKNKSSLPVLLS